MTYWDTSELSEDGDFRKRTTAAAADEANPAPEQWAFAERWRMAAAPGFSAAYGYAVLAGTPNPGRDEAVISDAMILAQYQYLVPPPGTTPEVLTDAWVKPRLTEALKEHGVDLAAGVVEQTSANALLARLRDVWAPRAA